VRKIRLVSTSCSTLGISALPQTFEVRSSKTPSCPESTWLIGSVWDYPHDSEALPSLSRAVG